MPDSSPALYARFLDSGDSLWVRVGDELRFRSAKGGVAGLVDYLARYEESDRPACLVFDRIVGNAAALLLVAARCLEVHSPVGSALARKTLDSHGIAHHFGEVPPNILNRDGSDVCPMEKLSLGKTPAEFALAVAALPKTSRP